MKNFKNDLIKIDLDKVYEYEWVQPYTLKSIIINLEKRLNAVESYLEEQSLPSTENELTPPCRHENLERTYYTVKSTGHKIYRCSDKDCKFDVNIEVNND